LLQDFSGPLGLRAELLEAKRKAEAQAEEIRQRKRQTEELLAGAPTLMELEDEQRYWRSRGLEVAAQRKLLTSLAAQLANQSQILEGNRPEWQATWEQVNKLTALVSVVTRVREELDAILSTQARIQEQLNLVLTIQNQVSQQVQQATDALDQVRDVRERERSRLLDADAPPLWEGNASPELEHALGPAFRRSFSRSSTMAKDYFKAHKLGAFGLVVAYLLALLGVLKLRHYVQEKNLPEVSPEAIHALDRPFSVALLTALLGMEAYIAAAPTGIVFIFYLLYLIPVSRLLVPMIDPQLGRILSALAVFYTLGGLYQFVQLPMIARRNIYALLVLAALVSLSLLARRLWVGWRLIHGRKRLVHAIGVGACLLLLAASLTANVLGYVSLSQILGMAPLVGPFIAAALYCGLRVLTLVLNTVLRTQWAFKLPATYVGAIGRWGRRFLVLGALLLWLRSILNVLTIHELVMTTLSNLFQRTIGFEKLSFTLGGVLTVALILFIGYCLANVLAFFLKTFVLPKLPLQRGLPFAISTVTYYICLLVVGLAALSSAGVELNKFTVLTGALGVGVGFGLQNIVNNFLSGLILILERPIHVGDTVEVGGITGTVRRIGARSSTVLTYQGAEVIVPNSNFLSNQVINWTLSSPWRRVDVRVGVAHGTDPEQVIGLLEGVAKSHSGVLLERPPVAFFLGFGESVLNFELRFWCARQDTWFQLQSDVTVAVAKALREACIEIPFPQRDLHIHSVERAATEELVRKSLQPTLRA
jgi:small-conductance mechanosensitive channel